MDFVELAERTDEGLLERIVRIRVGAHRGPSTGRATTQRQHHRGVAVVEPTKRRFVALPGLREVRAVVVHRISHGRSERIVSDRG